MTEDIASEWSKMIAKGRVVRMKLAREQKWRDDDQRIARAYERRSTEELKMMWDDYGSRRDWETFWEADIDDVYRALQLRGEGSYCAI